MEWLVLPFQVAFQESVLIWPLAWGTWDQARWREEIQVRVSQPLGREGTKVTLMLLGEQKGIAFGRLWLLAVSLAQPKRPPRRS